MAQPPVPRFEITELSGSRRAISLAGRAGPYRGIEWGLSMRTKKTYYPGNPRGTIQVLGPEYDDTPIRGCWKDPYVRVAGAVAAIGFPNLPTAADASLAGGTPTQQASQGTIATAQALVEAFEAILQSGNALRVENGRYVREGVLKTFSPRHGEPYANDVTWEMTFEWEARDEAPSTAGETRSDPRGEQRQEMANVDQAATSRPSTVNRTFAVDVQATQRASRSLGGSMFDALRIIGAATGAVPPTQPVASLISLAEQMRVLLDDERARIADTPRQLATLSDEAIDLLNTEVWRRTLSFEQENFRNGCLSRATAARALVAPGAITIITVPGATTLRLLAQTYYGSADSWQVIADANQLVDSLVQPGTILVIPPAAA